MSSKKKVAILLVLYNSRKYLNSLIKSIKKQTHKELSLYVINCNALNDEEEYLSSIYPAVIILQNAGNIGYAKGNNILAQKAYKDGCDYLLVLNPDMELTENTLQSFLELIENDSLAVAWNGVLLFPRETREEETIQMFGGECNYNTQNKRTYYSNYKLSEIKLPKIKQSSYLNGGCLFLSAKVFQEVGMFEEKYFMYNDEIDLLRRIRDRGYKAYVTSKTKIYHHHDWSNKNIPGYKIMYYYMMRNRVLYYRKFKLYPFLIIDLFVQLFSLPLKVKMFYKYGSLSILKYYYWGLWRGMLGETGRSNITMK